MLMKDQMNARGRIGQLGHLLFFGAALWAQHPPPAPPHPPKPPAPSPAIRLADIRKKLDATGAVNATAARALLFSRLYLDSANQALRSNEPFTADRLAGAADALLHVAEHQQHLHAQNSPKRPTPPPEAVQNCLQRVYFRLEQADYFLEQAHDPRATTFPKWARDFYQVALRAYDHQSFITADENAKCAEEVVMALENLAQAAAPARMPPPPPPPGRFR